MMSRRVIFVLAWLIRSGGLMAGGSGLAAENAASPAVTIDDIAAGIEKHIRVESKASGGYFKLHFQKQELRLELVRVHLEDWLTSAAASISRVWTWWARMDRYMTWTFS